MIFRGVKEPLKKATERRNQIKPKYEYYITTGSKKENSSNPQTIVVIGAPKGKAWWRYSTYFRAWKRELDENNCVIAWMTMLASIVIGLTYPRIIGISYRPQSEIRSEVKYRCSQDMLTWREHRDLCKKPEWKQDFECPDPYMILIVDWFYQRFSSETRKSLILYLYRKMILHSHSI